MVLLLQSREEKKNTFSNTHTFSSMPVVGCEWRIMTLEKYVNMNTCVHFHSFLSFIWVSEPKRVAYILFNNIQMTLNFRVYLLCAGLCGVGRDRGVFDRMEYGPPLLQMPRRTLINNIDVDFHRVCNLRTSADAIVVIGRTSFDVSSFCFIVARLTHERKMLCHLYCCPSSTKTHQDFDLID